MQCKCNDWMSVDSVHGRLHSHASSMCKSMYEDVYITELHGFDSNGSCGLLDGLSWLIKKLSFYMHHFVILITCSSMIIKFKLIIKYVLQFVPQYTCNVVLISYYVKLSMLLTCTAVNSQSGYIRTHSAACAANSNFTATIFHGTSCVNSSLL